MFLFIYFSCHSKQREAAVVLPWLLHDRTGVILLRMEDKIKLCTLVSLEKVCPESFLLLNEYNIPNYNKAH